MSYPRFLSVVALAFVALAFVAVTSSAQAQQTGTVLREAEDDDMMVQPFNMKVEDLEDANLVNQAGDDIGDVEKVLVDANGQPAAIAAEVGGFLGIGQKTVVISLDRLQPKDDDLVTTLSKEDLGALQAWDRR
jgi:hypothetical protein